MANTDKPYRRLEGDTPGNSWGELIDDVNDELENPPDGCDPIEPIEATKKDHVWAKKDIEEVQDKLDEMPTNCFTWDEIPDKWEIGIIEEIEEKLFGFGEIQNVWCDCDPCCYKCPNEESQATTFLGSYVFTPDMCRLKTACEISPVTTAQLDALDDAQGDFGARGTYSSAYYAWCRANDVLALKEVKLEKLEEDLEILEAELSDLEQQLAACESITCNEETEAAIEDKEAKIEEQEAKVEEMKHDIELTEQRIADFLNSWTEAKTKSDGACAKIEEALDDIHSCGLARVKTLMSLNKPIPAQIVDKCWDPENPDPNGPAAFCCHRDWWACRISWVLQLKGSMPVCVRCNGTECTGFSGHFRALEFGVFDIDGSPCTTGGGINRATATIPDAYCTLLGVDQGGASSCSDNDDHIYEVCQNGCGANPQSVIILEYQVVTESVEEFDDHVTCKSGEPC